MPEDLSKNQLSQEFNPQVGDRVMITRLSDYQFPVTIDRVGVMTDQMAGWLQEEFPGCKAGDKLYGAKVDGRWHEFHQSKIVGPAPK